MQKDQHILSIVPYKVLPPTSGGHLGIVYPHHYLGQLCTDHVVSTVDNADNDQYAFQLHKVFPASAQRYIPYYMLSKLKKIATTYNIKAIYCDHPYMALTAMALSKQLKVPWFIRSHNIESERFREFGKRWWPVMLMFERYVMNKANGVLLITPEDVAWAQQHYKLPAAQCHLMPYGTILNAAPAGHAEARNIIAKELQIDERKPWLYFLGALDYAPNEQAVSFILDEIMPRLDKKNIDYQILIAGKNLAPALKERINAQDKIIYTGFIPDIDLFLKACDIMLNPVILGGGIKTKAVEALGYNKIVISSESGAAGIDAAVCGGNLHISADNDWDRFTDDIIQSLHQQPAISQGFYDTFYWGNIARKVVDLLIG